MFAAGQFQFLQIKTANDEAAYTFVVNMGWAPLETQICQIWKFLREELQGIGGHMRTFFEVQDF